ncbi:MAG TPA: hypothetical protein VKA35_06780 [Solirubrobacterales bacterium]|nr:hypothetical protein [Solirubrobacterales bacterium]
MSRFHLSTLTVGLLLLVLAAPPFVSAAPSQVVVNTLTPKLEPAKSGGGSKLKLEFANITDGPAVLTVDAVGQRDCSPTLSKGQLPPNQITAVEVEVPGSPCDKDDDVLKLRVTAQLAAGASQAFLVDPEGSPPDKPEWESLFVFPVLLLLGLPLLGLFLFKGWEPHSTVLRAERGPAQGRGRWRKLWDRLREPLTSVDVTTWKFNDNWATNVTAAGALLTGIFGATTAKAFLGPDAESLTALPTVGAAITAVLVGAAPIVVLATKSYAVRGNTPPGDFFTVGGILLGAALVTTAAVGQLAIVGYTATELSIGLVAKAAIWIGFALAAALILVYTRRSLKDLLERGTEAPSEDPEPAIEAATLIANAIKAASAGGIDIEALEREVQASEEELSPQSVQSPHLAGEASAWRRRPRSALI